MGNVWMVAGLEQEDQKMQKDAHIAVINYDPSSPTVQCFSI